MKAFWTHVMAKSSVAQPAVVFGGDYNCKPLHWTMCLTEMNISMNSRKKVQLCESKAAPRTGDTALVMNATAFQEESRFGKSYNPNSFTDAHDVVLVPLHFPYKDTPSSVAQPASNRRTDREAQKQRFHTQCPRNQYHKEPLQVLHSRGSSNCSETPVTRHRCQKKQSQILRRQRSLSS